MNERTNILIVDDEEVWRKTYEKSIRQLDVHSIRVVGNLADAMQAIDEMRFAAAIIDIGLNRLDETNVDGLRVMEKLRAAGDETGIVVITGRSGSDVIDVVSQSIQKYGAVATFAKGKIDHVSLRNAITSSLRVHAEKMARKRVSAHREIPHAGSQLAWDDLMMRVLGINEGVAVLYELLEKLLRPYLPLIGSGEGRSIGSDLAGGVAHGAYWSRAIGMPVVVSLGRKADIDKETGVAPGGMLDGRYESGEVLAKCTVRKATGTVRELKNYGRSQFARISG